jgi:hypothetical protein
MATLNFDFDRDPERPASYSFFCGHHGRVCWSDECDALPKECEAPTPLARQLADEKRRNLILTRAWEQVFYLLNARHPNATEYP